MHKKKEKLLMIITIVLCVLLFAKELTGDLLHGILGLLLLIVILIHVCRQMKKMKYKKASIRKVDIMLMASLAVLVLTGILLHPLQGMLLLKILHKLSAVLFVIGMIVHVLQHRKEV